MNKFLTTKNAAILIAAVVFFFLVLMIKRLLIRYLPHDAYPLIWLALAIGLSIFLIGQIRKYRASQKRKASIMPHHPTKLERLFGIMNENLVYILDEVKTIPLPDDLKNKIKETCRDFQKILFNGNDRIHTLAEALCGESGLRPSGIPEEDREPGAAIDAMNKAITDQLYIMHHLVLDLQKRKDDDETIALASVLVSESAANILTVYADIKDEFKLISGSINEVQTVNEPAERSNRKLRKTTLRVIKVSDQEYQLPCSVCGEIAVTFKIGTPTFSEQTSLIFTGIIHETGNVGDAERIFAWLAEGNISEVHLHVMEHATMEEGIDAYCPDCDKIYCRSHYNPREEWEDNWWYDCTYGTCPEGHERIIHD